MLTAPEESLRIALPVVVDVFSTVPSVISSRVDRSYPSLRKIVPHLVFMHAEVSFAVPDTVILPVGKLNTAMPEVAETVPPEMVTALVE
jgi:hypothetical protein